MWAVKELEGFGVIFPNPEDKTLLARLSPQTTLAECVELGGTKYKVRMTPLPFEEDIVVFEGITVEFEGKEQHPSCRFHIWDEGTIWPSDLQLMVTEKDSMESMRASVAA